MEQKANQHISVGGHLHIPVTLKPALRLHLWQLEDSFIQSNLQQANHSEEGETTTYRYSRYSGDDYKTKCQALTIARLSHSLCTTKIARIRSYTTKSFYFVCVSMTRRAWPHLLMWRGQPGMAL